MQCTPCWLLICQDQSTGYAATCFTHTPEMIIPRKNSILDLGEPNARLSGAALLHPATKGSVL